MAKLFISEFNNTARDARGNEIHIPPFPPRAEQAVDFTAGATQSAAFGADTRYVRLVADEACNYAVGPSPTATTNSAYLPANVVEYISVPPAEKISVI
jgi:hypothetical protein